MELFSSNFRKCLSEVSFSPNRREEVKGCFEGCIVEVFPECGQVMGVDNYVNWKDDSDPHTDMKGVSPIVVFLIVHIKHNIPGS